MFSTKLNLFSEFILSKIGDFDSELQLCDCKNFIIIKGYTTSKNLISFKELTDDFNRKYCDYKIENTIDLLEYVNELSPKNNYTFNFENTNKELNNIFFKLSEFPYGFSMNQGKLLYFYFKFIVEKLPPNYFFKKITFEVNIDEKKKIDFLVYRDMELDENIVSLIKDCFSFNIGEIKDTIKKMDLEKFILNPQVKIFEEFKVEDFILI